MSSKESAYEAAVNNIRKILAEQVDRVERISKPVDWIDYSNLDKLVVGVIGGDGIGPIIAKETSRVLETLLKEEIGSGRVEIRQIEGLTIENRIKQMKPPSR